MKWLALSSRFRAGHSRVQINASVKKRKRKNRLAPVSGPSGRKARHGWFLALIVLVMVGAALWWSLTHSARFTLRRVQVSNNHSYAPPEVIALAGVQTGENLFCLQPENLRQQLLKETNIREATVERIFPDTLRIRVFEREPRARVKFGRYYTIDGWGVVLRERKESDDPSLPVISGLRIKNGLLYPPEDGEKCLVLLQGIDRQGINSLMNISEINLSGSDLIVLRSAEDLEVRLSREDIDLQLGRLKKMWPHLANGSSRARSVDLRYSHVPVEYEE